MRKAQKIIVAIWFGGLGLMLILAYILVFSHDVYLWRLNRSLAAVQHPSDTKRISTAKDLGLLVANGNHCDYFVAELRSYSGDLTPRRIKAFYKNTRIWNPLNRRNEHVSVAVIENGKIRSNENWTGVGPFLKEYFQSFLPQKLSNEKLYFVLLLDIGNETGCDIRCL